MAISRKEIEAWNERNRIYDANSKAVNSYLERHLQEIKRYPGNWAFVIAANGEATGFVCARDIEYIHLIKARAKERLSDGYWDNPRIEARPITRDMERLWRLGGR